MKYHCRRKAILLQLHDDALNASLGFSCSSRINYMEHIATVAASKFYDSQEGIVFIAETTLMFKILSISSYNIIHESARWCIQSFLFSYNIYTTWVDRSRCLKTRKRLPVKFFKTLVNLLRVALSYKIWSQSNDKLLSLL